MAGLLGTLFLFLIFALYANSQNTLDFTEKITDASSNASRFCIEIQPKVLSTGEKNYLIWFHKSLRDNVSKRVSEELPRALVMKKIKWSNALEKMAKKWALECGDANDANLQEFIGQYTSVSAGNSDKVKLKNLLRTWKAGWSHLTPEIIAKYRKPKHGDYNYEPLTQILWWKTEHFGCGRSVYKKACENHNCTEPKTVVKLVCNYFPKGNNPGEPVYFSGENKGLICNYDSENAYCISEGSYKTKPQEILTRNKYLEEEKERVAVEYRTRGRMIELWPATSSQVNAWQKFNIRFFYLCVIQLMLSYLNNILTLLK